MMTTQKRITSIKAKLQKMGPFISGSISEQWNTCGTQNCACKALENPIKHGPYYQLSFSVKGKHSTMFISKNDLSEVRRRIKRYQDFKNLNFELLEAYVALAREVGFNGGLK